VLQIDIVKEQSKTGLEYALAQHRLTIVDIHVEPVRIFMPFQGDARQKCVRDIILFFQN